MALKEEEEGDLSPSREHSEKRLCEDKGPFAHEEEFSLEAEPCRTLQNCEKIKVTCLSHPACGTLLQQPERAQPHAEEKLLGVDSQVGRAGKRSKRKTRVQIKAGKGKNREISK